MQPPVWRRPTSQAATVPSPVDVRRAPAAGGSERKWRWWVLAIAVLGLVIRVTYTLTVQRHLDVTFRDSLYYHDGALHLADGRGFINPIRYAYAFGVREQSAAHPPAFQVVLALPALLGLRSVLAHQLSACVLGAVAVALTGVTGRRLGGRRAGLVAALLAAVHPFFWLGNVELMSETLVQVLIPIVILLAYELIRRRSAGVAAGLGASIGLATLTRSENLLLLPLLVLPLVVLALRDVAFRRRMVLIGICVVTTGIVVAPWVGFNLTRFHRPVTLSTNFDVTLAGANCPSAYFGPRLGYWDLDCVAAVPRGGDESDTAARMRSAARSYLDAHVQELPRVLAAREARTWGLYRPLQQARFDAEVSARDQAAWYVGLGLSYVILAAAVAGGVLLRRRRTSLVPLLGPILVTAVAVLITNGGFRFRAGAEVSLVLLAAPAFTAFFSRRSALDQLPVQGRRLFGDGPP